MSYTVPTIFAATSSKQDSNTGIVDKSTSTVGTSHPHNLSDTNEVRDLLNEVRGLLRQVENNITRTALQCNEGNPNIPKGDILVKDINRALEKIKLLTASCSASNDNTSNDDAPTTLGM